MKQLTEKEEALMKIFWQKGPLFVREIVEMQPEPRPHVNTISTFVRILEEKGYLCHEKLGNTYRYRPTVSATDYGKLNVKQMLKKYFNNSLPNLMSELVKDENISDEEVKELINRVTEANKG